MKNGNLEISAFKLTIIAAVVVLVLSVGLVGILGGDWKAAAPYITLVGTIAIPSLLSLARSEANAQKTGAVAAQIDRVEEQTEMRHVENTSQIDALRNELTKGNMQ